MNACPAIEILYQDDACLVALKPSGLLSVPGRGDAGRDCLAARVQAQWPDAMVVHRLDMATSGLMLMARGAPAQRLLSQAFAERRVDKRYVAMVHGHLAEDRGVIELPLGADWPNRPRQMVDPVNGKPSQTRWHVMSREGPHTRLSLEPVTGRAHQLRVHLQAIGHPILGDALYAHGDALAAAPRLLLHATSLRWPHPLTGEALAVTCDVPF